MAGELEPLREQLNAALKKTWEEWEIPREADAKWPDAAKKLHADWWQARIARQKEIDASIAAKAEFEYLYDKPYEDKKKVRVAGPFTVESLSPHRVLGVDENDELIDPAAKTSNAGYGEEQDFVQMILENLKTAGVQQAHKEDKITFTVARRRGRAIWCAPKAATWKARHGEKRAAIFIGPEFGTVSAPRSGRRRPRSRRRRLRCADRLRLQLRRPLHGVQQARPHSRAQGAHERRPAHGRRPEEHRQGQPVRHLRRAGHRHPADAEDGQVRVKVNGVDVFHPNTGEVRSDGADGIACWFIDTDYNEESFFVRHAYFLGANDPYKALKTTLKAEINEEAWATLQQRHLPPLRQTEVRPHRRESDQPPRRRSDEGVQDIVE